MQQGRKETLAWKLGVGVGSPTALAIVCIQADLPLPLLRSIPDDAHTPLSLLLASVAAIGWLISLLWIARPGRRLRGVRSRMGERIEVYDRLWEINRTIASTLELEALLPRLAERMCHAIEGASCSILLVDREENQAVVRANWGRAAPHLKIGSAHPLDEAWLAPLASSSPEPLILENIHDDPRFETWMGSDGRPLSLLALPLRDGERIPAIVLLYREGTEKRPCPFHADETGFAHSVADLAASAISNTLRYQQAVQLSITDPLTGVYNRRYLVSRLEFEALRAKQMGHEVTVAIIDIDRFKDLNDFAGHSAGDIVLRRIAEILQGFVRRSDTVARIGGEEFCLLFPDMTKADAGPVLEKLRRQVAETDFSVPGIQLNRVTISTGFATFTEDGDDIRTLFDAADAALYGSKRAGRNRTTSYVKGMELHPERQRGRAAAKHILEELALQHKA